MHFSALWCYFVLLKTVQCAQQLSCRSYQKDGFTNYLYYPNKEGILDAQPTGCDVSYEHENGTSIAVLDEKKLPYVENVTINELTTTICIPYVAIKRACVSEGELFEGHCNINCNDTSHSILDQSSKPTHSILDQSSKPTHSILDQSSKPTHSILDQSSKPTHSILDQSSKPTHSILDQSSKPTHSNEDQRNLLLSILLPIGFLVVVAIALLLMCPYKGNKSRCSMSRLYTTVKTTNDGPQAKDIELGDVNKK